MTKIKLLIAALVLTLGVGAASLSPAYAACSNAASCVTQGVNTAGGSGAKGDVGGLIKTVVNILLFVIGAVAVIMIVIGGLRYTISQGDSSSVSGAKNTILYAVVGLVVALFAYAIVNFVLKYFI